ncbi:hypothetical protein AtEden1_Chr1g0060681 [Arabidopsis thaliana]
MYSMISTIDSRISYVSCGLNLGSCKGQENYESKRKDTLDTFRHPHINIVLYPQ